MEKLLKLPTMTPVSLGYSCHPSMFILRLGSLDKKFYERYVFDWLGSSMWSICKLIENDFADLNAKDLFVYKNHFSTKKEFYVTNTKYNIIFAHDYPEKLKGVTDTHYKDVMDKYNRRIIRFKELLASGKQLLFIRIGRDTPGLIQFPEYGITQDEQFYLEKFCTMMKDKGVSYKILYFTTSYPRAWDPVHNICYVQYKKKDPTIMVSGDQIMEICMANLGFIQKSLE